MLLVVVIFVVPCLCCGGCSVGYVNIAFLRNGTGKSKFLGCVQELRKRARADSNWRVRCGDGGVYGDQTMEDRSNPTAGRLSLGMDVCWCCDKRRGDDACRN